MLMYEKLKMKPHQFQSFTGLKVHEFQNMLETAEGHYDLFEKKRLGQRKRQRKIGAGRQFRHNLADQMLMCLVHLRLHLTMSVLGYLFDLHDSNICRNLSRMRKFLRKQLPGPRGIMAAQKKINSIEELYRLYPELKAIVDGTEQPIQRPKDAQKQKDYYSGKKKQHTIKKQLMVNRDGLILDLSPSVEGKRHDFKVFEETAVMDKIIPKDVEVLLDSGYQGAKRDHPDRKICLPVKATKLRPLNQIQKAANRKLSRARVRVEHAIRWLKRFRILSDRFRHPLRCHDEIFSVVAGLVNRMKMERLGLTIPGF